LADNGPNIGPTTRPAAEASPATAAAAGERKPYARPRILSRERLESMAATCTGAGAKFVAGIGGCQAGQVKS
jgi:hypothetical protein